MISSSVGSDFTEEFKLPSSDSQEAFDLLEDRFPQQSGVTAEIVYKAPAGADSAAVKRKMEGVFAEAAKLPHVSEVASPYVPSGAAAMLAEGFGPGFNGPFVMVAALPEKNDDEALSPKSCRSSSASSCCSRRCS